MAREQIEVTIVYTTEDGSTHTIAGRVNKGDSFQSIVETIAKQFNIRPADWPKIKVVYPSTVNQGKESKTKFEDALRTGEVLDAKWDPKAGEILNTKDVFEEHYARKRQEVAKKPRTVEEMIAEVKRSKVKRP